MKIYEYILCSGSGNRFLMFDSLRSDLSGLNIAAFAARESASFSVDGVLLLTRDEKGRFAMRMFNTDGSEAEMCGNGIRCVARLAHERYTEAAGDTFVVTSGGREYRIFREEPIFGSLTTFGVEIPLTLQSPDFAASLRAAGFVSQPIPELDAELRFSFLAPGNPHIAAHVPARSSWLFDAEKGLNCNRLASLGEQANRRRDLFPKGINVSLFCRLDDNRIFAVTYERGVGITSSCGTAMTSCATAAALLGLCDFGTTIDVWNRGGAVRCLPRRTEHGLVTRLTGNATFEAAGTIRLDEEGGIAATEAAPCDSSCDERRMAEQTARELTEKYGLTLTDKS